MMPSTTASESLVDASESLRHVACGFGDLDCPGEARPKSTHPAARTGRWCRRSRGGRLVDRCARPALLEPVAYRCNSADVRTGRSGTTCCSFVGAGCRRTCRLEDPTQPKMASTNASGVLVAQIGIARRRSKPSFFSALTVRPASAISAFSPTASTTFSAAHAPSALLLTTRAAVVLRGAAPSRTAAW